MFKIDGPFYRFGAAAVDSLLLGLYWLIFSLPLVTIGASTTALFYVSTRRIAGREGYLFSDFYSSFKRNFKQATLVWVLWVAVAIILFNYIFMMFEAENTTVINIITPLYLVIAFQASLVLVFVFPIIARFNLSFVQVFKNCFYLMNRHIFTALACIVLFLFLVFGIYVFAAPLLVGVMGIYAYFASHLIMRVFKKYRPDMDKDDLLGESIGAGYNDHPGSPE